MLINGKGQVAVVVGGGQNLGEYLCLGLAENGYSVVCMDINEANALQVAARIETEYKVPALGLKVDAVNEASVSQAFAEAEKKIGSVGLLVYNAGIAYANKITDFPLKDWEKCLDINLTGYFLCAKYASTQMITQQIRGTIIQINSKSGKVGSKHNAAYSAAKFGGWGLTQTLALDLAEHGITVHALMLGNLLDSPLFKSLTPQYAQKLGIKESEVKDYYINKVPLRRGCEYSDVLHMLLFYASPYARYETGQALNITGGQVMH